MTTATTTPLSDTELDAIRVRVEAASPGPWISETNEKSAGVAVLAKRSNPATVRKSDGYGTIFFVDCALEPDAIMYSPMEAEQIANAEFATHARCDVPRLLAEIERLRAREAGRDPTIVRDLADAARAMIAATARRPSSAPVADAAMAMLEAGGDVLDVTAARGILVEALSRYEADERAGDIGG